MAAADGRAEEAQFVVQQASVVHSQQRAQRQRRRAQRRRTYDHHYTRTHTPLAHGTPISPTNFDQWWTGCVWYGYVLRKEDDDWVKKCMEYEVAGPRPRGRPKRTWREVVKEDCLARKLNKEYAMDRSKWRKLIKEVRWSGWVWVGECFFWYRPTRVVPNQRPLNGCVCVCVGGVEAVSPDPAPSLQL